MKRISVLFVMSVLFAAGFGMEAAAQKKKVIKKATVAAKRDWSGNWTVPSRFGASELTVKMLSQGKFKFELDAFNGANTGSIKGTAKITGDKAFFDDRESTGKDAEKKGCRLTFTHKGDLIEIEETNECSFYRGNAVVFAEKYQKDTMLTRESDFVYLKVFPDKKIDWNFRQLTGFDYEKFLDSFHLITQEENIDEFGANVFSACVRGICNTNAAIIMFDEIGNFWAAVVYPGEGVEIIINYYSNAAGWTAKMPKTIEKWLKEKQESNENVTIYFKNK